MMIFWLVTTEFNPCHARDHDMHLLMRFHHSARLSFDKDNKKMPHRFYCVSGSFKALFLFHFVWYFQTSAVRLAALNDVVQEMTFFFIWFYSWMKIVVLNKRKETHKKPNKYSYIDLRNVIFIELFCNYALAYDIHLFRFSSPIHSHPQHLTCINFCSTKILYTMLCV